MIDRSHVVSLIRAWLALLPEWVGDDATPFQESLLSPNPRNLDGARYCSPEMLTLGTESNVQGSRILPESTRQETKHAWPVS